MSTLEDNEKNSAPNENFSGQKYIQYQNKIEERKKKAQKNTKIR